MARALTASRFPLFLTLATLILLVVDHVPRFYQGDSTAYLSTGLNGWVPLDRSWAYGPVGRWIVTSCRSSSALIAVQSALLALGLFSLQRALRRHAAGVVLPVLLPCLLVLDPLNQALARFWLTDAPACGLFLCFLACVPGAAWRGGAACFGLAFGAVLGTVFLRVAYIPVELGTLLCCLAVTFRPGAASPAGLRRRLLLLCLLPLGAAMLLGLANSRVVPPPARGHVFLNRMSPLYTMGVFLPALRETDFARAGVRISPTEFRALRLDQYDRRELAIWADGPTYVRSLMQERLHLEPKDVAFERACSAVVRSALLHHPQDLLRVYGWSTWLYLSPARWHAVLSSEFGFERALPGWVVRHLEMMTRRKVAADLNAERSPLPTLLDHVVWGYPILLLLGLLTSIRLLLRRAPFGGADLLAAAMLASFAAAPLYSHALKPRYMLPSVLLAGWTTGVVLANDRAALRRLAGRLRRTTPVLRDRAAHALRDGRAATLVPALLAGAGVLVYVAQLRLGRWQGDDYTLLADERGGGWDALVGRLAAHPLPFSETLLQAYGALVLWSGRPLIEPFLFALWFAVAAAVTAAAWWSLPPRPARLSAALAIGLGLFAFALTSGPVTALFYWPMAAASCLPTVGAVGALPFLLSNLAARGRRLAAALALLVAGLSSEVGAAVALAFALAMAAAALVRHDVRRWTAWWIVPGAASLVVLVLSVVRGPLSADDAAARALPDLPAELLTGGTDRLGGLLLGFGIVALWRCIAPRARFSLQHAALACALLGGAMFSAGSALVPGGERQLATRLWFGDVLAVLVVLGAWTRLERSRLVAPAPWMGALCIAAALLLPLRERWPGLLADGGALGLARSGHDKTWASGRAPGRPDMAFFLPPTGGAMLVRGTSVPGQRWVIDGRAPALLQAMGRFFGKSVITVCQPWQSDHAWLVQGRLIEACPAPVTAQRTMR